jgi:hypothetical protein
MSWFSILDYTIYKVAEINKFPLCLTFLILDKSMRVKNSPFDRVKNGHIFLTTKTSVGM